MKAFLARLCLILLIKKIWLPSCELYFETRIFVIRNFFRRKYYLVFLWLDQTISEKL